MDDLINNAGIADGIPASRMPAQTFRDIVEVDLTASFLVAREVARVMPPRGGSSKWPVSWSPTPLDTLPMTAYSAAKAGLLALMRSLARQWTSRKGIRVNSLSPGFFPSEITEGIGVGDASPLGDRIVMGPSRSTRGGRRRCRVPPQRGQQLHDRFRGCRPWRVPAVMSSDSSIRESAAVIGGYRTRVLEVAGTGPSILLLHGFTDSADTWRDVLDDLSRAGRHAVAVDLPGHGHAEPSAPPWLPGLDRFTAAFVDAYASPEGAALAGNSLGGLLAVRAASDPSLPLVAVAGVSPAGLAHHARLDALSKMAMRSHVLVRAGTYIPIPRGLMRRAAFLM